MSAVIIIIGLAVLAAGIATLVSVLKYPDTAFKAAGTTKGLWIALPIVGMLLCGIVAIVAAVMWFSGTKAKVEAATV